MGGKWLLVFTHAALFLLLGTSHSLVSSEAVLQALANGLQVIVRGTLLSSLGKKLLLDSLAISFFLWQFGNSIEMGELQNRSDLYP